MKTLLGLGFVASLLFGVYFGARFNVWLFGKDRCNFGTGLYIALMFAPVWAFLGALLFVFICGGRGWI